MLLTSLVITSGFVWVSSQALSARKQKKRLLFTRAKTTIVPSGKTQTTSFTLDNVEISRAEKEAHQDVIISSSALTLAAAGMVFYPPLSLLSIPFLIRGSAFFFQSGFRVLLDERRVNSDLLSAMVASVSIIRGYYLDWAIACTFLHLGRKFLLKTRDQSQQKLTDVFNLQSESVWVLADGVEVEVPFEAIKNGEVLVVGAGTMIPVDGKITDGIASVDQQVLTGEAQPVEKEAGDLVFASTVVLTGRIYIQVDATGKETQAAKVAEILQDTVSLKLTTETRGEFISDRMALPTLLLSATAFATLGPMVGLVILNARFALFMRVLGPIGMLRFLNTTSRNGIVVKDGRILDLLPRVDTVVFDKTGTLTQDQPHVGRIYCYADYKEEGILRCAAAAESRQSHPIARAILEEVQKRQLELPQVEEADCKVGYGVTVMLDQQRVSVGSFRFMNTQGVAVPVELHELEECCGQQGYSLVLVAVDEQVIGAVEMIPTIRPEAKAVINRLRQLGIKSMFITSGDRELPTRQLAQELGIDRHFANVLPEQKGELIEQLQQEGKFVCYIGDGINDAIALKKANVSISLGGASTVATDTAHVILMDDGLTRLPYLFKLAKTFNNRMLDTLALTILPGLVTVPGAFFLHFQLIHSILINQASLAVGLGNVMLPTGTSLKREIALLEQEIAESESDK